MITDSFRALSPCGRRVRSVALAIALVGVVTAPVALAESQRIAIFPPIAAGVDGAEVAALPTLMAGELAQSHPRFESVRSDQLQQALKAEGAGCASDVGCIRRVLKGTRAAWALVAEVKPSAQKFSLTVRLVGADPAANIPEHTETMKYLRNLPLNVPPCLSAVLALTAPSASDEPPPPPPPEPVAARAPVEEAAEALPPPPSEVAGAPRLLAVLPFVDASSEGHRIDSGTKQILEEDIRTVSGGALSQWGYTILTGDNMLSILADNGIDPNKACEASCSLQAARELKADFFVAASVALTEGSYTAILRLFEAKSGRQLGFAILEGNTIREIRKAFSRQMASFFKRIMVADTSGAAAVAARKEPAPKVAPPQEKEATVEKTIVLAPLPPPKPPSAPVLPPAPTRPQAGPDLRWLGWVGFSVGLLAVAGGGGARLYAANIYNSDKITTTAEGERVHSASAQSYALAGTLGQVSTVALIAGGVVAVGSGTALFLAPRSAGGGGEVGISGSF